MIGEKIEYFRDQLTQRLGELLAEVNKPVKDSTDLNQNLPDPNDRATAESDMNFTLRIRERETKLMIKLQEALKRIENGTYGICEECEEEISEARLKARPMTILCIDCKREQEIPEELVSSTVTGYAAERIQILSQRILTTKNLLNIINRNDLFSEISKG